MSISSFQLHCHDVRWRLYGTSVSYARPARSSPSPQSHASTSSPASAPIRCPPRRVARPPRRSAHRPGAARARARTGRRRRSRHTTVADRAAGRRRCRTPSHGTGTRNCADSDQAHPARSRARGARRGDGTRSQRRARRRHSPRTTTIGTPPDSKLDAVAGCGQLDAHAHVHGPVPEQLRPLSFALPE